MIDPTLLLVLVVILALAFDFSNGWHDSANAIATVVSTHVLIILATAVDMKAPAIFKTAASSTARPGVRTWVETTVAIALALSCQPFEKSNARARITTRTKRRVGSIMVGREV